jgi:hypothetical protein
MYWIITGAFKNYIYFFLMVAPVIILYMVLTANGGEAAGFSPHPSCKRRGMGDGLYLPLPPHPSCKRRGEGGVFAVSF